MTFFKKYIAVGLISLLQLAPAQSRAGFFGVSDEEVARGARSRSTMPIFEGQQSAKGSIQALPAKTGDFIQAQDEADGFKTRFWRGFSAGKYLGFSELVSNEPLCSLSLTAPTIETLNQIASKGM